MKKAFELDQPSLSIGSKNDQFINTDTEAILNHKDCTKPINAAISALQKRKTKGSTNLLSSKFGLTGSGSSLSVNHYFDSNSNSSKSSLKELIPNRKSPKTIQQKSLKTIKQKLLLFDQNIQELHISHQSSIFQLESLPLEKLSDSGEIEKRKAIISKYRMKKFNSTSTLFIDSCLVNSELDENLK